MVAIVAGHLFTEGHLISHASDETLFWCLLLGSAARVATNVFILIGCHFLVEATTPSSPPFPLARRFWRVYSTTLVWVLPLTAVGALLWGHAPQKEVVRAFFPFFGRPLWFASAWMTLLLLVPFLRSALALPPRAYDSLCAVLAVLFVVNSTLGDFREGYLADTLWIAACYVFVGWLRNRGGRFVRAIPSGVALLAGCTVYVSLVYAEWWSRRNLGIAPGAELVHTIATRFLADIKSAPNFFTALAVFVFFSKLHLPVLPFVNAAARPAFAVYVAHQTPAFWPVLWTMIVPCKAIRGHAWAPAAGLCAAVAIYATIALAELMRQAAVRRFFRCTPLPSRLRRV